jgi:hypothetical protein
VLPDAGRYSDPSTRRAAAGFFGEFLRRFAAQSSKKWIAFPSKTLRTFDNAPCIAATKCRVSRFRAGSTARRTNDTGRARETHKKNSGTARSESAKRSSAKSLRRKVMEPGNDILRFGVDA